MGRNLLRSSSISSLSYIRFITSVSLSIQKSSEAVSILIKNSICPLAFFHLGELWFHFHTIIYSILYFLCFHAKTLLNINFHFYATFSFSMRIISFVYVCILVDSTFSDLLFKKKCVCSYMWSVFNLCRLLLSHLNSVCYSFAWFSLCKGMRPHYKKGVTLNVVTCNVRYKQLPMSTFYTSVKPDHCLPFLTLNSSQSFCLSSKPDLHYSSKVWGYLW